MSGGIRLHISDESGEAGIDFFAVVQVAVGSEGEVRHEGEALVEALQ